VNRRSGVTVNQAGASIAPAFFMTMPRCDTVHDDEVAGIAAD